MGMTKKQECFLFVIFFVFAVTIGMHLPSFFAKENSREIPKAVQQTHPDVIFENMSLGEARNYIRENSSHVVDCMADTEKEEQVYADAYIRVQDAKEILETARQVNIFNKAEWYNPFSMMKEYLEKRDSITKAKKELSAAKEALLKEEAKLNAQRDKCDRLDAEMKDLKQYFKASDYENIERMKEEKIDSLLAEDKAMGDGWGITFIVPVRGYQKTSDFGYRIHPISGTRKFHSGTDLAVDYGTPIMASAYGKVVFAGWYPGFGNTVVLSHATGIYTLYGHNSRVLVSKGDIVEQGQTIALAGSTGNSTGPHCHFSMWIDNELVNPMEHITRA